ncbi:MAG: hypothetical protein OHK0015_49090 [Chloroflexi bacterium OHK40]
MPWQRLLATTLNMQPGEGRMVALLLLHSFCLGVPLTFTEAVANSLFVVTFGAAAMPLVYIGFAIVSTLVGLAYGQLEARLPFGVLLGANLTVMALSLVALRLGLAVPGQPVVVAALAIWGEVLWVLAGLAFGALLGRLFTIRQGKRLFGLVGSGEVLAGILGGLLVPLAVSLVGTANLLLLAAGGFGVALLVLRAVLREAPPATPGAAPVEAPVATSELLRSRYVGLMVAFAALSLCAYFFLDNLFYRQLDAALTGEDRLASFLGVFYAAVGALTLLGKGLLSARLFRRFGITAVLLALPVAVALGAALVLLAAALGLGPAVFWLVALTKLLSEVLKDAVDQPVSLIMYQPLAPGQRMRAQTLIESVVEPLAAGVAGLLLLLAGAAGLGVPGLTLALCAILGVWLLVGRRFGAAYSAALSAALARGRVDGAFFAPHDGSTRAVVLRALASPHPAEALYALDLLARAGDDLLMPQLAPLLGHQAPELRRAALTHLERLRPPAALALVRERAHGDPDLAVREVALRAMAAIAEGDVFEELAALLDDPSPAVARGAMVGLLRAGGIEGVLAVGRRLIDLAAAPGAADRALAAEVLGAAGIRNFYQPLWPLLHDPAVEVRRAALLAVGQMAHPRLLPLVAQALASAELRASAEEALVAAGPAAIAEARARIAAGDLPPAAVGRLLRVCGRVGGPEAVALLEAGIDAPSGERRSQSLAALVAARHRLAGAAARRAHTQIGAEAAGAAWALAARADCAGLPASDLLARGLDHAVGQARARVLMLLALLYDLERVERARIALELGAPAQRAYALELLDSMLSTDVKARVLPLLDDLEPAERLRLLAQIAPQQRQEPRQRLRALAAGVEAGHDPWLRACACYGLGAVPEPGDGCDVCSCKGW